MIEIAPVQVTDEGVLIPRQYLADGDEFEIVISETYVLVRPKQNGSESTLLPSESSRFSFVGIAQTSNPNASIEVEEILEREIDRRSGMNLTSFVPQTSWKSMPIRALILWIVSLRPWLNVCTLVVS